MFLTLVRLTPTTPRIVPINTQVAHEKIIRRSNDKRILYYSDLANMHILSTTGIVMSAIMIVTVMAVCEPRKRETGKLALSEEQFEDLYCEYTIGLAVERLKNEGHEYRAIHTIDSDQVLQPPQPDCWALFNQYLQTNRPTFQKWANKYCRDYLSCWCCPGGGLCVTFVVKPTSPPCLKWANAIYQKTLAVFEA